MLFVAVLFDFSKHSGVRKPVKSQLTKGLSMSKINIYNQNSENCHAPESSTINLESLIIELDDEKLEKIKGGVSTSSQSSVRYLQSSKSILFTGRCW